MQRLIGVPGLPGEGWLADGVGLVAVAQCSVEAVTGNQIVHFTAIKYMLSCLTALCCFIFEDIKTILTS